MVKLKRVYDPVSRTDGARFLVERLVENHTSPVFGTGR
jgi:uncharacterized protein YeaO (DUF488 family)